MVKKYAVRFLGLLAAIPLAASVGAAPVGIQSHASSPLSTTIKADYIEARTASVWAGGCHYSAEEETTGRDAILAWSVASGNWNGVDLRGVRALAVVSSDTNLESASDARKFVLAVDSSATPAQAEAVADMISTKFADSVGRLVKVDQTTVSFSHNAAGYTVSAPGLASINMKVMTDPACCFQEQSIWYEPLVPITNAEVGYTVRSSYDGGILGDRWNREGENSAFYGSIEVK